MSEKYNKKICWLWLVMSIGVASPTIWDLMSKYQTVEEVCRYVQSNDIRKKVVEVQTTKELLVDCIRKGINVICYSDKEYPSSLKDMHNPPSVLFCKGDLSLLNQERLLTVVGTRNPTDYTVRVTSTICDNLVKENFILISGSALGVDSIAHRCAINNRKPTISVLACGIDYDYPKGGISLRNDILSNGGLILTEQLPNTPPYRGNFPKRNRILAGLGNGTFVTEASLGSGALITANYSYKMGKPIFCIPPTDIFNERFLGVAKYIRDGAICVFSHNDIMYEYFGSYPSNVRQTNIIQINDAEKVSESPIFKDEINFKSKNNVKEKLSKMEVEKPKFKRLEETEKEVEVLFNNLSTITEETNKKEEFIDYHTSKGKPILNDKQSLVIQSIKKGYNYLDDISTDTGIDISELFEIITDLELDGIVKSNFGNKYTLI
ncbi:MAG: DNA-processing protein DprA [Oscillospiraceae bacterium]